MSMLHNLAQLVRYRGLIQSLVARELKARYRGSVLGFFWSFINPLLLLLDLLVRLQDTSCRRTQGDIRAVRAVHVLRHPAVDLVLVVAARIIRRADLRRQPDQEGAVSGRESCRSSPCWRTWCTSLSGCRSSRCSCSTSARRSRRASCCGFRSSMLVQLIFTLGCALLLSALTVHFRDIRDILGQPADVLVLRDADHLPVPDAIRRHAGSQTAARTTTRSRT